MKDLLSSKELRIAIENILSPYTDSNILIGDIVKIVNSQKIAHANMVIGRDYTDVELINAISTNYPYLRYSNEIYAVQRRRNV